MVLQCGWYCSSEDGGHSGWAGSQTSGDSLAGKGKSLHIASTYFITGASN